MTDEKTLDDVARRSLREQPMSHLQAAALQSAANAVFITDSEGRIEWANAAFVRLTGFDLEEVVGKTPRILKSGKQSESYYESFWKTILAGEVWTGRVVNRHRDGSLYTVEQTVTPMRDELGEISHFVAIHEDITARIEAEEKIAHMARHDFLTNLLNRYAVNERLETEASRSTRLGTELALLWLDLDCFKDVNDTFGHLVGDSLLVAVARRLQSSLRDTDSLGRLGGDEFAVVGTDLVGGVGAAELARRLLLALRRPFQIEGRSLYVTASIGISIYSPSGGAATVGQLMKQADLALYRAKQDGGNTFHFFSEQMDEELRARVALGQALRGALDRGELFLEYQPQVDVGSGRVVGAEALLRWRRDQRELVAPEDFIPIAEATGLILPLGEWVLRAACTQAAAWCREGYDQFPVAVNVSAIQCKSPGFFDSVIRILEETRLEPRFLELELTERVLLESGPDLQKGLLQLADRGIRISLDDFGQGYSSFEYLRRLPFSKLKIAPSFVRNMQSSWRDAAIVSAVVELARKLGLQVIAEGLEPEHRLDLLVREGCREVQGFYFSRPLPVDDFTRLLAGGGELSGPG